MDVGLSAGAVSRRLGIAVTTLRTWHQRYGLGPTGHAPGSHRRYTEDDLIRLEAMRRLTGEGIPAAEAARLAVGAGQLIQRAGQAVPGGDRAADADAVSQGGDAVSRGGEAVSQGGRAGGGTAIPVGRAGRAARGIAGAAMRLDGATVRTRIMAEVSRRGVVATWTDALVPILIGVGVRHHATKQLIEVEHLLSRCISEVLAALPQPVTSAPARVLLACADEEQHSLPLEALGAALAEHGHASRMLGARVPPQALAAAVRKTGPTMVLLWSHARGTGDPAQLRALQDHPVRPAIVAAGGPGWRDLPTGVLAPATLQEALTLALAVAG